MERQTIAVTSCKLSHRKIPIYPEGELSTRAFRPGLGGLEVRVLEIDECPACLRAQIDDLELRKVQCDRYGCVDPEEPCPHGCRHEMLIDHLTSKLKRLTGRDK